MNLPLGRPFGLAARGGAGLVCDQSGVSLGGVDLIRASVSAAGIRQCEVRSRGEVARSLRAAYGAQPDEVIGRLHRGLHRTAVWLSAGDLGRAGIEAVMLRLPELTPQAIQKLAEVADLEKAGAAWETEPRVPAGQAGGGQWTTDGGTSAAALVRPSGGAPAVRNDCDAPRLPLDDGVFRPGVNRPSLIHTGAADEAEPPRIGDNGGPKIPDSLAAVFPGLNDAPALAIPLSPIDGFLGTGALVDAANLTVTMANYRYLISQIKTVKPDFEPDELLPPGGIAGLSWQGRAHLIDDLRMQRAAAFYNVRGEVGPLQVETLRFLQSVVDNAYEEGVAKFNAGRLQPRLSREEAIGNYIDIRTRYEIRSLFNRYKIEYGRNSNITINNRIYNTSGPSPVYRIPDASVGDVAFEWTLTPKNVSTPQVRGFFNADSSPSAVIIIRPTQFGRDSIYLIPRPENF